MRVGIIGLLLAVTLSTTTGCANQNPVTPGSPTQSVTPLSGISVVQANASTGPRASEQVVFSGVATSGSSFPGGSPVGFWIWCEAESTNPYAGECNGSMYFYALGVTRHVEGEIEETGEDLYQMTVSSTRDSAIIDCLLSNTDEPVHGPRNTVQVSCSTPFGSAISNNAVVNVTGPALD
jgi:hypothetical protein